MAKGESNTQLLIESMRSENEPASNAAIATEKVTSPVVNRHKNFKTMSQLLGASAAISNIRCKNTATSNNNLVPNMILTPSSYKVSDIFGIERKSRSSSPDPNRSNFGASDEMIGSPSQIDPTTSVQASTNIECNTT